MARASGSELRRTGLMQGLFLVGVAIVAFGLGYLILEHFYTPYKKAELRELNAQITEVQGTLATLESKTWNLELVNYSNGTRGIVLPKGMRIERTTKVKDGREIVLITK